MFVVPMNNQLWKGVCSLNCPNKIKNLMWRACRNSLPTKVNLVRRTILNNPSCDRRLQDAESTIHAVWSCPGLDVVWSDPILWSARRTRQFVDFKELLSWMITNHQDPELFATIAWSVWTHRNQVRLLH